ncbi:ABC transporter permease [Psychrobium sp. 1_MG-2023]|uniref:ABC transporter permease n=1 Tax=Psychrobium sp. 1_MG-2023 TaxID=3062624 RepID=UPI000C31CA70|nr:ABC transporter permease [Psychrobium sp. 1_MG-2023]MDP2559635.1 ABC transporter permease [Psychrobium sp. 1_MG-2023]PKF59468.1 ABC transporter permease [Alteromonadales bacterium alter-6D02]
MVVLNNEIKLIVSTHLAFYRRSPWLILLFILGFSLGSALLTAITGLNQEAKNRHQHSSALLNNPVSHLIEPLTGKRYIDGALWLKLRQWGFTHAQPVLRGQLNTVQGRTIAIQGVDSLLWFNRPASSPQQTSSEQGFKAFSLSTLIVDRQFSARLFNAAGEQHLFKLPDKKQQPDVLLADDVGLWAITDLANADYLLGANGQLSYIELSQLDDAQYDKIALLIKGKAQLVEAQQQEFDVLSEAFFFNLTALAMLGYIVAAFLSFNAIKLTLTARKKLLAQMHLLGCTQRNITLSLTLELMVISLVTALLGSLGGYLIANGLVLDINRTLVGLYQLDKALVIHWQWSNVLLGFALNVCSLLLILLSQMKQVIDKTKLLSYGLVGGVSMTLLWLLYAANTKYQALVLCLCILLLFILLTPKVLAALVALPVTLNNPLAQWLQADTRFHLKDLHIAIIAILVALGSAIGMQIMVHSFSDTLNAHLEKQLSADVYLRSNQLEPQLRQQLAQLPEVKQLSIYLQSEGKVNHSPTKLASFGDSFMHYQHISLTSGVAVSEGNFADGGCLANEQSKIKHGLSLGDKVRFVQNDTLFDCRVSDFFYDYGNASMLFLTLESRHQQAVLNKDFFGYSIRLIDDHSLAQFSERLINEFKQDSTKVLPNKRFKRYANALFNDTFMVTKALNGFMLGIALLSLCTSLLSLSNNQLKQLTILRHLGVTQRQLLVMKLSQTAIVVLFTALFAIPLGLALGVALLTFVMPIAFGWTIHFSLDLPTLLLTCLTLVVVSVICAYLPIRQLTNLSAKEQS